MPIIKDKRLIEAKKKRSGRVRARYKQLYENSGKRHEVIIPILIDEFYIGETTITNILSNKGKYKE